MRSGDDELRDLIRSILADERDRTAHQIQRIAERTRAAVYHHVNGTLFRNPELFQRDRSDPPRWSLRRVPTSRPARSNRTIIDALPTPYAWQSDALDAWRAANERGVVEAVTGAGKTYVGVAAVRDAVMERGAAVILVPSTPLLRQWRERLLTHLPGARVAAVGGGEDDDTRRADVVVATVQTAARRRDALQPPGCRLLVADECHRYGADTFQRALLPTYQARLGLTATYARMDAGLETYLAPFFGPTVFHLGYERALGEDVVSPWSVTLLAVTLDAVSWHEYEKHYKKAAKARSRLVNEFGIPAEPFGEFLKSVSRIAGNRSRNDDLAQTCRTFIASFNAYREALAESPAKIDALRSLAPRIREANGALAFTQSIASAEACSKAMRAAGLRSRTIHADVDDDTRSRILHGLRTDQLDLVVAPRVLDEGIDVPDADLGIIIAASSTRRQMVQRMGRVLRKKTTGRDAHFVIMYARGTVEDPAKGAHGSFLEEILPLAKEVRQAAFHRSPTR